MLYWLVSSNLFYDNIIRWMPQDLTDDKSTLVQVMAWCRPETCHYLTQCWPDLQRRHMVSLGPNELKSIDSLSHRSWVTHMCFSKLGHHELLKYFRSLVRCQSSIRIVAGLLLIWVLGTNSIEIFIDIHIFSSKDWVWRFSLQNPFVLDPMCIWICSKMQSGIT